jgi:hypothetical protein
MCLLIYMNPNTTVPFGDLETASINNPDGFGWAIIGDNTIHVGKSMNFNEAYAEFAEVRRAVPNTPALFHLRIATHGQTNLDNCHPFLVGGDHQTVLAHNGMLDIRGDHRSDTRIFAEEWLPTLGVAEWLDDETHVAEIEQFARGSKLVVLSVDPLLDKWAYILNEHEGDWGEAERNGIWYSNSSYKQVWYTSTQYGYLGSRSWADDDKGKLHLPRVGDWNRVPTSVQVPAVGKWFGMDESQSIEAIGLTIFACRYCDSEYAVDTEWDSPICPDCLICSFCHSDSCECEDDNPFCNAGLDDMEPISGSPRRSVGYAVSTTAYLGEDGTPYVYDEGDGLWNHAAMSDYPEFKGHVDLNDWLDLFPSPRFALATTTNTEDFS